MPKPLPDETEDTFVSRCVPIVLDDGTADTTEQAVAICHSLFESKKMTFIEQIRERKASGEFGYGITTADRYVERAISECGDGALCKATNIPSISRDDLLKEAAQKLVYSGDEMVKEATSRDEFKSLLPKGVEAPPHTLMVIRHVMTSPREDRDRDILRTEGAKLDPKAPLLWQHIHQVPIGKVLGATTHNKQVLKVVVALLDLNDLTSDIAKLFEADALRFSHGFIIQDAEERKDGVGLDIKEFEILEDSAVSVPSNIDAEVELFAAGKLESDLMKAHAKTYWDARVKSAPGITFKSDTESNMLTRRLDEMSDRDRGFCKQMFDSYDKTISELTETKSLPRYVKTTKSFVVENEVLEASTLEYSWISRFIGCEIKDIMLLESYCPAIMKGSFLSGIRENTRNWKLSDTRNITHKGQEVPPTHELVTLNSTKSDTFLQDGLEFWTTDDGERVCIKTEPGWGGSTYVTTYTNYKSTLDVITRAWEWAHENNFLKGEAFALTGDFLERGEQKLDTVYLEKENKYAVQKTIKRISEKGASLDNRGMIFMGPPGTGKTLSGRVLMNSIDATFIWVSARDFWRTGSISGICQALDMARSLAPSVVFFEDVDNWIGSQAVDVLKTELDGIAQTKGVVTILTTNYPERLPDSLIDRPGRFHDVLEFHLPSKDIRTQMMMEWVGLSQKDAFAIAEKTDGYSGAHLHELAKYAKTIADEDELDISDALVKAIEKIEGQRALIDASQLSGSHYRPHKDIDGQAESYDLSMVIKENDQIEITETLGDYSKTKLFAKSGRTISKANAKVIGDVLDDLRELAGAELTRAHKALLNQSIKSLEEILSAATDVDEDDTAKSSDVPTRVDVVEAAQILIASGDDNLLRRVSKSINTLLDVGDLDALAQEYRSLHTTEN